MASLRLLKRQEKRFLLITKYKYKRLFLKSIIMDKNSSSIFKKGAQTQLQKLPRDSNLCRLRKRCFLTGRGKGVYSFVGLCRNMFRYYVMKGDIPGFRKSSW